MKAFNFPLVAGKYNAIPTEYKGIRYDSKAEARRAANDAFRLMTVAVREREALDHFHDKSRRLWQRAFQAEEQKMFDELAVQRQPGSPFEINLLLN